MLKDGSFGSAPEEWSAPLEVLSLKLEEARVLVDGILALRRIDSTASIRDDHINLTEVARTAAKRAQPRARLLHGSVVVDADRIGSAVAQGDQDRTLRILDNSSVSSTATRRPSTTSSNIRASLPSASSALRPSPSTSTPTAPRTASAS